MPDWITVLRVAFYIVLCLAHALIWERICFKTGFSRLWAIPTLFPPMAIGLGLMLALRTWPVHVALRDAHMLAGTETDEDIYDYLREGCRMEHRGDAPAAMARYMDVAERFPDRQPGRDALNYLDALRNKIHRGDGTPEGDAR